MFASSHRRVVEQVTRLLNGLIGETAARWVGNALHAFGDGLTKFAPVMFAVICLALLFKQTRLQAKGSIVLFAPALLGVLVMYGVDNVVTFFAASLVVTFCFYAVLKHIVYKPNSFRWFPRSVRKFALTA